MEFSKKEKFMDLKKSALVILSGLLICAPMYAKAEEAAKDYKKIIDVAGRQRMLSQKMTKEALLIQTDTSVDQNKASLQKTMDLFKTTLSELKAGGPSADIAAKLGEVETAYAGLEALLTKASAGKLSPEDLTALSNGSVDVLTKMNDAVGMYEKESGISAAVEVNLAGKQRMLSQKIAKEMLLIYLGVDTDANMGALKKSSDLFTKTLAGLKAGDKDLGLAGTSDAAVVAQLDAVQKVWESFAPTIENVQLTGKDAMSSADLDTIDGMSTPLLEECAKVVALLNK